MKRFAILFSYFLCLGLTSSAQSTYTQHLQQQQVGKGKVTVNQSKEIDNLVNGVVQDNKTVPSTTKQKETVSPVVKQTVTPSTTRQNVVSGDSAAKEKAREVAREEEKKRLAAEKAAEEKKAEERRAAEAKKSQATEEEDVSVPTVDMRKKVMRNSKKVQGFRVQAFAGGNTRVDKQKAQSIGNAIKMRYPDQPIYVHFYSPRWICRVGNYRTYAEAETMLKAIRAMGYKSATIVKGKISVFE